MKRPPIVYWIKKHWYIVYWLPWGGTLWNWADDKVKAWHKLEGR